MPRHDFMKIAALFLLIGLQQAASTVEYKNPELNLAFSHPKSWEFKTDKKGVTKVTIPTGTPGSTASMEIYSVAFNGEGDAWQNVQKEFLKQMKRDVVRQWQEEILGVPMLMTRGGYEEKGNQMAMLTGLMYSRTPRKMLFRLIAPAAAYDAIEFDLRSSLQSLHTINGALPLPEDPNRKITPEDTVVKPVEAPPKVTVIERSKPKDKLVKGSQSLDFQAGGKPVKLQFGPGWTAERDAAGGYDFHNPAVAGSIHIIVNSTLDSDHPEVAMFKASGLALNDFEKVTKRDETNPAANKAGAFVSTIWRVGTSSKGAITSCEAAGMLGDFYWLATYKLDGTLPEAGHKAVELLFSSMSVESTP